MFIQDRAMPMRGWENTIKAILRRQRVLEYPFAWILKPRSSWECRKLRIILDNHKTCQILIHLHRCRQNQSKYQLYQNTPLASNSWHQSRLGSTMTIKSTGMTVISGPGPKRRLTTSSIPAVSTRKATRSRRSSNKPEVYWPLQPSH